MREIKEIEIDGEKVFISKSSLFGYKIVHPFRIDGKINWKNFLSGGSWWNILIVAIIVALILGAALEYRTAVNMANECLRSKGLIDLL